MEVHEPPPWTPAWFAKPALPRAHAELMARSSLAAPMHQGWKQSGAAGASFQEFHGGFGGMPEDYWVFRATSSDGSLRHDRFFYQLGDSTNPTLERVRWVVTAPASSSRTSWLSFHHQIVNRLSSGKASVVWAERDSAFASVVVGDSRFDVQLHVGRAATVDSFVLERTSSRLIERMKQEDPWGNEVLDLAASDVYDSRMAARRGRVESGLRRLDPDLAPVLTMKPDSSRWPAIWRMLDRSRDPRLPRADRHLFRLAAHTALVAYAPKIGAADSVTVRRVRVRLRPFGSDIAMTYDGLWCYDGRLLDSLLIAPAEDRWTEEAFLQSNEDGWEPPCGFCGQETSYGPDQWRAVLDRGGAFLRATPNSRIAPELNLLFAEAHETAWSLSKSEPTDYIGPAAYRLDAPEHRLRAIELYEQHLRSRPDDPQNESIRRRLLRLRIDIDTEYHPFYCFWD